MECKVHYSVYKVMAFREGGGVEAEDRQGSDDDDFTRKCLDAQN